MMRLLVIVLAVFATGMTFRHSASAFQPATERAVTVNVEVRAADGGVVEAVAVCAWLPSLPIGLTGSNGVASLSVVVPTTASCFFVSLAPAMKDASIEQHNVQTLKYLDVTSSSAFDLWHKVTLVEGESAYNLTIAGSAKVEVIGKLVNLPSGLNPTSIGVHHANGLKQVKLNQDGTFRIGAIRKDAASEVYVYLTGETRVLVLPISAAQAASDVDLGDISVGNRPSGRKVAVTVGERELVKGTIEKPYTRAMGVTFVSQDGSNVHFLRVDAEGRAFVVGSAAADDPKLPSGTYFVCPGILDGLGAPKRLLDLLRQQPSRALDLEAAGVPKIIVPSDGQTNPVVFHLNASQAEAAIEAVQ